MKKLSRLIFPLILALLCAGVIWFLHNFTVSEGSMVYIDWTHFCKNKPRRHGKPCGSGYIHQFPRHSGLLPFHRNPSRGTRLRLSAV